MAYGERDIPTRRSEGDRSCLTSCLVAAAIILVLLVCGGAGTYLVGRTYIERQLPEWQARYPALGMALSLLELRSELAGVDPAELRDAVGPRPGVDDKALLPADIPVLSDPLLEAYSIGEDHVTGYQRLEQTVETLAPQVRGKMQQQGWELAAEQETPDGWLLVWQKTERVCTTEIVAYEGYGELWLRCSGGGD